MYCFIFIMIEPPGARARVRTIFVMLNDMQDVGIQPCYLLILVILLKHVVQTTFPV